MEHVNPNEQQLNAGKAYQVPQLEGHFALADRMQTDVELSNLRNQLASANVRIALLEDELAKHREGYRW